MIDNVYVILLCLAAGFVIGCAACRYITNEKNIKSKDVSIIEPFGYGKYRKKEY